MILSICTDLQFLMKTYDVCFWSILWSCLCSIYQLVSINKIGRLLTFYYSLVYSYHTYWTPRLSRHSFLFIYNKYSVQSSNREKNIFETSTLFALLPLDTTNQNRRDQSDEKRPNRMQPHPGSRLLLANTHTHTHTHTHAYMVLLDY